MSHMTKEERKANNIRNETQRRIDAGDTSSYVQSQIRDNPNTFTNAQPAAQSVFSPQDMNIQPAQSVFSPQDMNIQPAQPPAQSVFSPQDMNIQPASSPTIGTDKEENLLDRLNNSVTFGKPIKDLENNDLKLILEQVKLYQDGMPNYFQGIPGGFNFVKGIFNSMGQGLERSGEFGGVEGSPTLEGLEDYIRRMDPDSNMLDSFKEADPAAYLGSFGLPQTEAGLNFFANLSLDDDTVDKKTQQKIIEARERLAQSKESQDRASGIMTASSAPANVIGIDLGQYSAIPEEYKGFFESEFAKPVAGGMAITYVTLPDGSKVKFGDTGSAAQFRKYLESISAIKSESTEDYPEGYGAFLLNPPAPVRPGTPTIQGFPDKDGDGVDDRYQTGPGIPRPGIENVGPLKPKTNLPAAFNYASIAPQFTGSQYTNQGVSPAFLENLRRFYG